MEIAGQLSDAFGIDIKEGRSSNFAGSLFEVMNTQFRGGKGHIAIRTNNIDRAVYYLSKRGYETDESSMVIKNGKKIAVYLNDEFGGFAIHLLQK